MGFSLCFTLQKGCLFEPLRLNHILNVIVRWRLSHLDLSCSFLAINRVRIIR